MNAKKPLSSQADRASSPADRFGASRLHAEHRNLEYLLLVFENHLEQLDAERTRLAPMVEVLRFTIDYLDLVHSTGERLAFARAAERDHETRRRVHDLDSQYRAWQRSALRVCGWLERAIEDEPVARRRLASASWELSRSIRRAIVTEEQTVLPLVARVLAPADWQAIAESVAARTLPVFGRLAAHEHVRRFEALAEAAGCGCRYEAD